MSVEMLLLTVGILFKQNKSRFALIRVKLLMNFFLDNLMKE